MQSAIHDLCRLQLVESETLSFGPLMTQLEATPNIAQLVQLRLLGNPVVDSIVPGSVVPGGLAPDNSTPDNSTPSTPSTPSIPVILTNTHLFWRPDYDGLRVLQAHRLRRRVEELRLQVATETQCDPLIIMCGGACVYCEVGGWLLNAFVS